MTAPSPAGLSPLLDQLDEAHAKGTADGFWRFVDHGDRFGADNRFEILDDEGSVAVCSNDNDATETTGFDRVALIVAAVNALPQLVAAVRGVLKVADELEANFEHGDSVHRLARNMCSRRLRSALTAALTPGADTAGATA